jgi:hypothetical protein
MGGTSALASLKWSPYFISPSGRAALRAAVDVTQRAPACPEITFGKML